MPFRGKSKFKNIHKPTKIHNEYMYVLCADIHQEKYTKNICQHTRTSRKIHNECMYRYVLSADTYQEECTMNICQRTPRKIHNEYMYVLSADIYQEKYTMNICQHTPRKLHNEYMYVHALSANIYQRD